MDGSSGAETGFKGESETKTGVLRPRVRLSSDWKGQAAGVPETDDAYAASWTGFLAEREALNLKAQETNRYLDGFALFDLFQRKLSRTIQPKSLAADNQTIDKRTLAELFLDARFLGSFISKNKVGGSDLDNVGEAIMTHSLKDDQPQAELEIGPNFKIDVTQAKQLATWVKKDSVIDRDFDVDPQQIKDALEVAKGLEHELRNPITIIDGYLEMILDENYPMSEEDTGLFIQDIRGNLAKLKRTAETVGMVFRDGEVELINPRVTRYQDFQTSFVETCQKDLQDAGIEVEIRAPGAMDGDMAVICDRKNVESALQVNSDNIVGEKRKELPNNITQVRFTTKMVEEAGRKFLDLFIIDNGVGFPENSDFIDAETNTGMPKYGATTKAKQTGSGSGTGLPLWADRLKKTRGLLTYHNCQGKVLPAGLSKEAGDVFDHGGIVRIRFPLIT